MAKTKAQLDYRERLLEVRRMRAGDIQENPRNPKIHPETQTAPLAGILADVGKVDILKAYHSERAGGALVYWDGHARRNLRPDEEWNVGIYDLTDSEADYLLSTFDPVGWQATQSAVKLNDLLRDVSTGQAAVMEMLSKEAERCGAIALTGEGGSGETVDAEPQIDRAAELNQKWEVSTGDVWLIGEHRLYCANSETLAPEVFADCQTLFFDPEWDEMQKPRGQFENVLAFADGGRIGDVVKIFGAPSWLFAWDCVTSWYTPNRPLKRMKLCAWYGDVSDYNFEGHHYGEPLEAKTVTNSRGSYEFKPDPRGKHLSDVFQMPITKAHADGEHSHSKPLDWVMCLLANCTKGGIYDPFAGSGVAMAAAQNLNRQCVAVEIEPNNCAVILDRMERAFPALTITREPAARSASSHSQQVKMAASPV